LPPDDSEVLRGTPMLGPNVWPALANFREDVGAYYNAALNLGKTLFRGFALALGLDESHFDKLVTKPPAQLRLIHYPCDPQAVDTQGMGAHSDYECFTILVSTAPGLEVMNGAGEWIDAPPVEGAFVVNIGDMMEVWTNRRIRGNLASSTPCARRALLVSIILCMRLLHSRRAVAVLRYPG
jgi:isopenicillin N synthase-like dioxygenase